MSYSQFCPIAKAMEVLGEKWTLLIVRELLMGTTRFNVFQRGLSQISPTLLTKRLQQLEDSGLLFKKRIPGQKGHEYFPTKACQELLPLIEQIGVWGMRWARHQLQEDDFDLGLLMLYMERSILPDKLIGNETVIRFNFCDIDDFPTWWIVVNGDDIDVCVQDPGKEVDVYFNVSVRVMCELWMGDISYKKAVADGKLTLVGPKALTHHVEDWIKPSMFSEIAPASEIVSPV
ncbi:MAG: winged helix-turn-helix transcriptional regulator [Aestuariibacter sp.]